MRKKEDPAVMRVFLTKCKAKKNGLNGRYLSDTLDVSYNDAQNVVEQALHKKYVEREYKDYNSFFILTPMGRSHLNDLNLLK